MTPSPQKPASDSTASLKDTIERLEEIMEQYDKECFSVKAEDPRVDIVNAVAGFSAMAKVNGVISILKALESKPDTALADLKAKADVLQKALRNREVRMRNAHRLLSELFHYEGLVLIDETRGDEFAETIMDGLSLGPPGGEPETDSIESAPTKATEDAESKEEGKR